MRTNTAWRRIRRVPLAVEAALALSVATVATRVLPQTQQTRLLGRPISPEDLLPPDAPDAQGSDARRIGRCVERVAALLPWRPKCLPQAIATRRLLRRRGITCESHVGVVGTEPFGAHAWITVHGAVVQGGPVRHATEVALLR